jgi:hypothetical protein
VTSVSQIITGFRAKKCPEITTRRSQVAVWPVCIAYRVGFVAPKPAKIHRISTLAGRLRKAVLVHFVVDQTELRGIVFTTRTSSAH